MTRALGRPEPLPYVDEADLERLAADVGAGVFSAADLYDWYVATVTRQGREAVSKNRFGRALGEAGWRSSIEYRDKRMTRCWMVSKPWARRGERLLAVDTPPSTGQQA